MSRWKARRKRRNLIANFEYRLLPGVKKFTRLDGQALLPARVIKPVTDPRIVRAADRFLNGPQLESGCEKGASLVLSITRHSGHLPRDGYRLRITPAEVEIVGESFAGCFYALQTLSQLADDQTSIPCCEISDWPDFRTRGLLHDTTRGKVPTLSTLKLLADRLASLKANQLQLYIEHSFVFDFDPAISDDQNGLTSDEIKELDDYCRDRFIALVPAVATLGHMGRILSLPQYRPLAEIEPTSSWEEMSWPQRARGSTLDVLNPASHALVACIWSEILDAFSSPVVNMCGDEPWDLGKGRNKDRLVSSESVGTAYIEHIKRTHEICARRGRRTQLWSDLVTHYPQLFERLPRDLTILHWGYDDRSDYEATARFVDAGLETTVCPGNSGWKRVLNAMNLAERNIAAFAQAGKENDASGLLNTDWGDHGHFNALACSWHGIALGSALAWNSNQETGGRFDRAFAHWLFADAEKSEVMAQLRAASSIAEKCETWRLLWQSLSQIQADPTLPAREVAQYAAEQSRCAIQSIAQIRPRSNLDRDELVAACLATQLFSDKVVLAREGHSPADIQDRIRQVAQAVAACWNARNKPSGLGDILTVFSRLEDEFFAR